MTCMDRFLAVTCRESPQLSACEHFLSIAAASSMVLASKAHEGKRVVTLSCFPDFPREELKAFESHLLQKIDFKVFSLCTPSSFLHHLVRLYGDAVLHGDLEVQAVALVGEFFLDTESTMFAPSTVAVAALIATFSLLHIDCAPWLAVVPDVCFARGGVKGGALDVDACLARFQCCQSVRTQLSPIPTSGGGRDKAAPSNSPTSVTALLLPLAEDEGVGVGVGVGLGGGVGVVGATATAEAPKSRRRSYTEVCDGGVASSSSGQAQARKKRLALSSPGAGLSPVAAAGLRSIVLELGAVEAPAPRVAFASALGLGEGEGEGEGAGAEALGTPPRPIP